MKRIKIQKEEEETKGKKKNYNKGKRAKIVNTKRGEG